ncbi:AAA family ATPase [Novosphingobium sp. KN65.2]|uniref:AAA family ATPase n=1 Tax=Novosphingobium sp. KN65.2 TaxID=1478134 RepID=UPI0005DE6E9C|nr:AAA family ATPase [Novosphingobium sp. KN65.2]CDO38307.1 hypothetical protein SPHV1_550024 [Novosphingobium sp. KN65.2]
MNSWDDIDRAAQDAERRRNLRVVSPNLGRPPSPMLAPLNLAELATIPAEAVVFAIERVAPLGEVTLFTGPGSTGKSLLAQQIATASAAGLNCLGLEVMEGPSLYVTCEDGPSQLHYRQERLCEAMNVPMASLAGKLHLVSLRGALDNPLDGDDGKGNFAPTPSYHRLAETIRSIGARIVALDNVAHLFTGNENDRGEVTRFVNLLNRLAGETGAAILLIGHPNKSGDTYSGSTAWLNAVRSQVWIGRVLDQDGDEQDPDVRVLTIGKANYAKPGEALRFRWHNWAFVLDGELPPDKRQEMAEVIKANGENSVFLRCLKERNEQQRQVSDKPTAANYAPRVFAKMPVAKGMSKTSLEKAMERLFMAGRIERGFLYRDTAEGKDIFGLREASGRPSEIPETYPESSRKHLPEGSGNPHKSTGNSVPYTYGINGAGPEGPSPSIESGWSPDAFSVEDDLDWGDDAEGADE